MQCLTRSTEENVTSPNLSQSNNHRNSSEFDANMNQNFNTVSLKDAFSHKYVIFCFICGGTLILLGLSFILVYFVLRTYTSSIYYFETIPTYIPSIALIVNGIIILTLSKKKLRYTFMIKISGAFCFICALICIVITVTTSVIHMTRLQSLQECTYKQSSGTCVCTSTGLDLNESKLYALPSNHYVFQDTPNCDVINGTLYFCLRILFGISVFGILLCIFTSMLVYQILSHERKKKYLQHIEIRRQYQYPNLRRVNFDANSYSHPFISFPSPFYFQNYGYLDDVYYTGIWIWPMVNSWDPTDFRGYSYNVRHENDNFNIQNNSTPENLNFFRRFYLSRSIKFFRNLFNFRNCHPQNVNQNPHTNSFSPTFRLFPSQQIFNASFLRSFQSPHYQINTSRFPFIPHTRRHRSNDGIFHHLQQLALINPQLNYPYFNGTQMISPSQALYASWGPPPPYSQIPSLENIHQTRTADNRSFSNSRQTNTHSNNEVIENNNSFKLNSPTSNRRTLCNTFSSEEITLKVENILPIPPTSKDSCIEAQVSQKKPFSPPKSQEDVILNNNLKKNLSVISSLKKEDSNFNPFKSLSNISISLNSKVNSAPIAKSLEKIFDKQFHSTFQTSLLNSERSTLTHSNSNSDCDVTEKMILNSLETSSTSSHFKQLHLKSAFSEKVNLNKSFQKVLNNSSSSLKKFKSTVTSNNVNCDLIQKTNDPILSLSKVEQKTNSNLKKTILHTRSMPNLNNNMTQADSLRSTNSSFFFNRSPAETSLNSSVQGLASTNANFKLNDKSKNSIILSTLKSKEKKHLACVTSLTQLHNKSVFSQPTNNQSDNIVVTIKSIPM